MIERTELQILIETLGEYFLGRYERYQKLPELTEYQKYEYGVITTVLKKTGLIRVINSLSLKENMFDLDKILNCPECDKSEFCCKKHKEEMESSLFCQSSHDDKRNEW